MHRQRRKRTVVLAGSKGQQLISNFLSDRIILRGITVKGALGMDYPAYEQAIRIIESGKYPLGEDALSHSSAGASRDYLTQNKPAQGE